MTTDATIDDGVDRIAATAELLGRTGASTFEIRYSEPESGDFQAIVWLAIAAYPHGPWDAGAGVTLRQACERLLEQLIDGGVCQHCHKVTTVLHTLDDTVPLPNMCAYQYDPESRTYYRGCEHR